MQEKRNLQESIVDKDNHAFDDLKMLLTMFFMSPDRPEADSMERLKKEDPTSYNEWMSVKRMHDEEQAGKGTLGDFEDEGED
jgi:type III secretory pathway component EscR